LELFSDTNDLVMIFFQDKIRLQEIQIGTLVKVNLSFSEKHKAWYASRMRIIALPEDSEGPPRDGKRTTLDRFVVNHLMRSDLTVTLNL